MKKILLIFLVFIFWAQGQALAYTWKVDPAHSGISFGIKHIYATVQGHFSDFSGEVFFDPDNLEKSRFDFVVKVDSINTFNTKRDNHLRSADFFDTGKYPEMTFKTDRVSHIGGNKYKLEGRMTIKNVTRNVVLEFIYWGQKEHPFNKKQLVAGFDARLEIDRLVYQVGNGKFYQMGVVGKDVAILITLEVVRNK